MNSQNSPKSGFNILAWGGESGTDETVLGFRKVQRGNRHGQDRAISMRNTLAPDKHGKA